MTVTWTLKNILNLWCKKASQKINALSRLASSMNFEQRRLIMSSFVICHFSYCPVVWMLHSRKLNARINRLHERVLRVVYKVLILWRTTKERRLYNLTSKKSAKTNDWYIQSQNWNSPRIDERCFWICWCTL